MKSLINSFTVILLLLSCSFSLMAQMPPHPSLLKKISNDEIDVPYTLQRINELRGKGIDAAWNSPINKFLEKSRNTLNKKGSTSFSSITGNYNALVVLVSFTDQSFNTDPAFFDGLLFSNNSGTLANYLSEITYGKLSLSTANLPSEIKVVRAPQTYEYYVNNQNGLGSYPQNSQKLVEDIINIINPTVDFSKYDNDGDGSIDALFIIHSGPGAEYTGKKTDMWSHAWDIDPQIKDGVSISHYSIEPEFWEKLTDMTCGVYAHEMGHAAFGLPDLYDYDTGKNASEGLGNWSLMAGGSWNGRNGNSPAHPDVFCNIIMGNFKATNLTDDASSLQINDIETYPIAYRLWKSGTIGSEYYLIENRQQIGYDATLPGNGLLIYHIDEDVIAGHRINNNEWYPGHTGSGHYAVALVQADGLFDLEKNANGGDKGDPFPGTAKNKNFTAISNPNNKSYEGDYTNFSITNINNSANIVTADISLHEFLQLPYDYINTGYVEVSTVLDTTNISILNSSIITINISNIRNFTNVFSIKPNVNLPYNLAPNEKINLHVFYSPQSMESDVDSIIIEYFLDKSKSKKIPLTGSGYVLNPIEDNILYGVIKKTNNGSIVTVNTSNGSTSIFGNPDFLNIRSLTISRNKILFGITNDNQGVTLLLRINPADGKAYGYRKLSKLVNNIAFDTNDVLYGISNEGILYRINLNDGFCDSLCNTNLSTYGFTFNPTNNDLLATDANGQGIRDAIYKINPFNGDTVLIGRTGFNTFTQCLTFDNSGNLLGIKGNLLSNGELIKIDPNSGVGTLIGNTGYKGFGGLAIYNGSSTDIEVDNFSPLPEKYLLEQNYPNPFNPTTIIKYQIPENSFVTLKIYDLLGKEVATLVNKEQTKGFYSTEFNAEKLSSGVYFYRLHAGSFVETRKMILLK